MMLCGQPEMRGTVQYSTPQWVIARQARLELTYVTLAEFDRMYCSVLRKCMYLRGLNQLQLPVLYCTGDPELPVICTGGPELPVIIIGDTVLLCSTRRAGVRQYPVYCSSSQSNHKATFLSKSKTSVTTILLRIGRRVSRNFQARCPQIRSNLRNMSSNSE